MTDSMTTPDEQTPPVNLHETTDAAIWAAEFCRIFPEYNADEGNMIGWFANAMMAQSDAEHRAAMRDTKAQMSSGNNGNREPLMWAVEKWRDEVQNRPLQNVHRRTLDDTWRTVMLEFGGDPDNLVGPSHDDLLAARGGKA
tara:strand:- start:559 stop:981 length:423 start_codon:yes stop_codon:yes gene_type:complete